MVGNQDREPGTGARNWYSYPVRSTREPAQEPQTCGSTLYLVPYAGAIRTRSGSSYNQYTLTQINRVVGIPCNCRGGKLTPSSMLDDAAVLQKLNAMTRYYSNHEEIVAKLNAKYQAMTPEERRAEQQRRKPYFSEYRQRPEVRAQQNAIRREYRKDPVVIERNKQAVYKWRKQNPTAFRAIQQRYNRKSRAQFPNRWKSYEHRNHSTWNQRYPWRMLMFNHSNRAEQEYGLHDHFTEAQLQALVDQYGWACFRCGFPEDIEIDHIIPLACGGSNAIDNIQLLCCGCHRHKGLKTTDYRGAKLRTVLHMNDWTNRARNCARRARDNYELTEHFTSAELRRHLQLYGERCAQCHSTVHLTIDHIQPLGRGGNNLIANIQILCRKCNAHKSSQTVDYRTVDL